MALMTKLILGTANWTTAQETLWPNMFANAHKLEKTRTLVFTLPLVIDPFTQTKPYTDHTGE